VLTVKRVSSPVEFCHGVMCVSFVAISGFDFCSPRTTENQTEILILRPRSTSPDVDQIPPNDVLPDDITKFYAELPIK
jgi:hypothetical protein